MRKNRIPENLILGAARGVDGITKLLTDGLEWPLPDHLDSVPLIEWSPEQLGLDPQQLGKLTSILQVPKLNSQQPFGVFILEFQGGRLPIGALRKVLDQLVHKQRRRKSGAASQWDLGDLVFFCHSSESGGSVHIAAWNGTSGRAELRTISWSSRPTVTHLDLLQKRSLIDLVWPDEAVSVDEWRDKWTSAFSVGYRQGIRSAAQLSQRMAEVAIAIREEVRDLLIVEGPAGPLHAALSDLRNGLALPRDDESFANVFAQALVYGVLTARVASPARFQAASSEALMDFENPFLAGIYSILTDAASDFLELESLGLADLVQQLTDTDIDQVLAQFGASVQTEDAVLYLYEHFLDKYDREERKRLGAYYTPAPLVDAMIRLVNHAIEISWELPDGIADRTTWAEWSEKRCSGSSRVNEEGRLIRMLDPAAGTGTFPLHWIRQLKQQAPHLREEIFDDFAALELSLASYAVAHLKLGLEAEHLEVHPSRMPIFLTDTLEAPYEINLTNLDNAVSRESSLAESVKEDLRFSVVLGNPPYQRLAREEGGGWLTSPDGTHPDILEDILQPARELTVFSNQRSIYNLYIYFWRWAIWKVFESKGPGPGIVCFVTASSWLSGDGFLGLRELVRKLVDDIWVLDLGGDNRSARSDENIFSIETGVSVVLLSRKNESLTERNARVKYLRLQGRREEKLEYLSRLDPKSAPWERVDRSWMDPLVPEVSDKTWLKFAPITLVFPWQQPGCVVSRTWPVSPDRDTLERRWESLLGASDLQERAKLFATAKTGRNIFTKVPGLAPLAELSDTDACPPIVRYGYRSFDTQFIIGDPRVMKTEGPSLWSSQSNEQVFMVSQTKKPLGTGAGASVFTAVPDFAAFRGSDGGKDVIPLYRDTFGTPNINRSLLEEVSAKLSVAISAEDFFCYAYGILAGSDYTHRFSEYLREPGHRIPITAKADLFFAMSDHGRQLISIQTQGERFHAHSPASCGGQSVWKRPIDSPPSAMGDIHYDVAREELHISDGVLEGVTAHVWNFNVSGMQVVKKWIGFRTLKGTGKAATSANPLDRIRPTSWQPQWSTDLQGLVGSINETVKLSEAGSMILAEIVGGSLVDARTLPSPTTSEIAVPSPTEPWYKSTAPSVLF